MLTIGEITIHWLNGGDSALDGGAMFGVVPKALWQRKYPCNDKNQINLRNDPLLIQTKEGNILIDAGMGTGRMSEKQKRNFGVREEANIEASLAKLNMTTKDIDMVAMTHLHFDHVTGLTKRNGEVFTPMYENAKIYTSEIEWEEMRNPNVRSKSTYVKENWEHIQDSVETFSTEIELMQGVKMIHTGGHSNGHAIITIESNGERALHLADLLPTHAHYNPLWVMAYDDYPMTSIYAKEKWINDGIEHNMWFTFYHDHFYRGVKWNAQGEIIAGIKRS